MKRIIIILLSTFLFSCSEDEINGYGTQLIEVKSSSGTQSWVEKYHYDSEQRLVEVENWSMNRRVEIQYADGRVHQLFTFGPKGGMVFRDSISYLDNGQVDKIYNFSINSGEDLPLSFVYEFEYDEAEQLQERRTLMLPVEEYTEIKKYFWKAGNIVKEAEYRDEELHAEYFYTYDDKINYKKDSPVHLKDPVNWTQNNILKMDWNDYLGYIDRMCKPCEMKYSYNLNDYPVEVETDWMKQQLTYQVEE